ncbi:hypothetical protein ACFL6U_06080 [Planctomycetota bacterium]
MKAYTVLLLCLFLYGLYGCADTAHTGIDRQGDIELVGMVNNIGVENAIIAQHTLYPYHFEPDGAKLNELGLSDLKVLTRHFREHSGTLNIRRGETNHEIYEARLLYVIDKLRTAGIEKERVEILDGMPGGSGMASEQVVKVLEKVATTPLADKGWSIGTGQ